MSKIRGVDGFGVSGGASGSGQAPKVSAAMRGGAKPSKPATRAASGKPVRTPAPKKKATSKVDVKKALRSARTNYEMKNPNNYSLSYVTKGEMAQWRKAAAEVDRLSKILKKFK